VVLNRESHVEINLLDIAFRESRARIVADRRDREASSSRV